jgi:hypothetical protein
MTLRLPPLALGLALGVALVAGLMAWRGEAGAWHAWGLKTGVVKFLDAQVIAAGEVAWSAGLDPLRTNPGDIGRRPMNYPRVWQGLYGLGLNRTHGELLGWTVVVLGLAGVWLAWPTASVGGAAFVVAFVFSPAILLGAERGNIDLAMFFLLALAVAVRSVLVKSALVFAAFVAKLFPLAGVAFVLARARDEAWRVIAVLGALAVAYLGLTLDDLRLIASGTPQDWELSYGRAVLPLKMETWWPGAGVPVTVLLAIGLAAALGLALAARRRGWALEATGRAGEGWWIGWACFVGTFLLGTNYVYRLIFLLLLVPQLWAWARAGDRVARVLLGAMLVAVWSFGLEAAGGRSPAAAALGFGVGQLALHTLFFFGVAVGVAAWPGWAVPKRPERA